MLMLQHKVIEVKLSVGCLFQDRLPVKILILIRYFEKVQWPKNRNASSERISAHCNASLHTHTVLHIYRQVLFGAGNQGNYQNFEKSLLTNKL
jgi:hypothetical protein